MITSPTVAHIFDCDLRSDGMMLNNFVVTYHNAFQVVRYSNLLCGEGKARLLRR